MALQYAKEKIVNCPYNSSHVMSESKLRSHLLKGCAEKAKYGHLYLTCKFDSLHIIRKERMDEHLKRCPSRTETTIEERLGVTADDLATAILNQFKPKAEKPAQIKEKNQKVPGFTEEGEAKKSKPIKEKGEEPSAEKQEKIKAKKDKQDKDRESFYTKAYGAAHSKKIMREAQENADDPDIFAEIFLEEEKKLKDERARMDKSAVENSLFKASQDSLMISELDITRSSGF